MIKFQPVQLVNFQSVPTDYDNELKGTTLGLKITELNAAFAKKAHKANAVPDGNNPAAFPNRRQTHAG
jgi:hypothetical protein